MSAWSLLLLLVGFVVLVLGGEVLVRGGTGFARALGMSPLVVGLTVVAFATSAPEAAVSLQAALTGSPGLAVGNVVGSNIANILLVVGLSALIVPLLVRAIAVRRDIPIMIAFAVALLLTALDGSVSTVEGVLLFLGLVAYVILTLTRRSPSGPASEHEETGQDADPDAVPDHEPDAEPSSEMSDPEPEGEEESDSSSWVSELPMDIGRIVVGVALLVLGSDLLVTAATDIAGGLGVSDLVIGLTVVAVGTSLPELATSLLAGIRGQRDLAVGNIVGSNIFNIGAVMGLTAIVAPDGVPVDPGAVAFDIPFMVAVCVALLPIAYTGLVVSRTEGGILFAYYIAFTAYVVLTATDHAALERYSTVMYGFVIPLTLISLAVSIILEVRRRRQAPSTSAGVG